jgi:hypothetical protein
MPIARLTNAAFDEETTRLLGAAFDAAWDTVKASGSPLADPLCADLTREQLAACIIELGRAGERNPVRLVEQALSWLVSSPPRAGAIVSHESGLA